MIVILLVYASLACWLLHGLHLKKRTVYVGTVGGQLVSWGGYARNAHLLSTINYTRNFLRHLWYIICVFFPFHLCLTFLFRANQENIKWVKTWFEQAILLLFLILTTNYTVLKIEVRPSRSLKKLNETFLELDVLNNGWQFLKSKEKRVEVDHIGGSISGQPLKQGKYVWLSRPIQPKEVWLSSRSQSTPPYFSGKFISISWKKYGPHLLSF